MKETPQGTIFDIRRFSTHDGNGIRTTMFLKGCPLSCVWCHNPEGIDTGIKPVYFKNKCINCGNCVRASVNGGVQQGTDGIILHPQAKEDWKHIAEVCPTGAISMDARRITVEQAMEELRKDKVFFQHDGGVTFSGGEPLLQAEFVVAVLKELKKEGIHTAIETALNVPKESLINGVPYLDLIYADFKIADCELHKRYTGVQNDRILENLNYLLSSECKGRVIIRTPMIPGITTGDENIQEISRYITGIYPEVTYEILNWNPLAQAKYHLVDKPFCFEENPSRYSKEEMEHFAEIAKSGGVKKVILDL